MKNHNSCGLCSVKLDGITVVSGRDTLIENINMTFHCGELTALIGKNGAGKTTLIRAILGERQYTGEITFIRHDEGKIKRPLIGYVPQHLDFDKSTPVSVADFMLAGKSKRPLWLGHNAALKKRALSALESLDCGHLLNKSLGNLSGGELQKVMLLAATDPMPDLLILDEPVSGVDAIGLEKFYKTVTHLRDTYHMAILLVSHDLSLIKKYADKVVLIDKTVLCQGEIDEVFTSRQFKDSFGYIEEGL